METIYIETTVVSYLVANPSRDSILAAHQQLTRQWWQDERRRYRCVTSAEVLKEAGLGDAEMSRRRLEALSGLTVLGGGQTGAPSGRGSIGRRDTSVSGDFGCHPRGGGRTKRREHSADLELPASGESASARKAA